MKKKSCGRNFLPAVTFICAFIVLYLSFHCLGEVFCFKKVKKMLFPKYCFILTGNRQMNGNVFVHIQTL